MKIIIKYVFFFVIGINAILFNSFLFKLYAQDFVPEMHHDSIFDKKEVWAGVEIPNNRFTFLAQGVTFDKQYTWYVFTTDKNGKISTKNIFLTVKNGFLYQLSNIHYVNSNYIITGVFTMYDTTTIKGNSDSYLITFKLDDNLNLLSMDTLSMGLFGGFAFDFYIKARLIDNKILVSFGENAGAGNPVAIIDTSSKIIKINRDTIAPITYDIAKNDSGYTAIQYGLPVCYVYLNDSLKVTSLSKSDWYLGGYHGSSNDAALVFNHQGLSSDVSLFSLKRLSPNILIQGGSCDSLDEVISPPFRKSMFCFVKTDNAGTILFKKGFTPTGWSDFSIADGTTNSFDFIDPNNIYLGAKAGAGFFVVNVDSNFNERWRRMIYYPDHNYYLQFGRNMFATSDGGCMLVGEIVNRVDTLKTKVDGFIVKLNKNGIINSTNEIDLLKAFIIYPNPANTEVNIQTSSTEKLLVQLYDITGKQVTPSLSFTNSTTINLNDVSAGLYFVRISNTNNQIIQTQKLSLVK